MLFLLLLLLLLLLFVVSILHQTQSRVRLHKIDIVFVCSVSIGICHR